MQTSDLGRQLSAGVIVGLSAIIYSLSYGALLFAGPLSALVGYGITIALVTAIVGALYGWQTQERAIIAGPDSNTISVLASMLAILGTLNLEPAARLNQAVMLIFTTGLLSALAFYAVARAKLAGLMRYTPFAVMAGFLVSTGWLMSSGALNIIAGMPLTRTGLNALLSGISIPELAAGLLVASLLQVLAKRLSTALMIPLVVSIATLAVHALLASGLCSGDVCDRSRWLFDAVPEVQWLPPWQLTWDLDEIARLVELLPTMLTVSFVGILTILLSIASLELSFQKEFDLNQALKAHALASGVSAVFGGFLGLISIGRTTLNRQAGGGAVAGLVASLLCLGALLGAGQFIAYLPKAALGGLVLYLGANLIKQWLWDQRQSITYVEFAQIAVILVLVVNYGFLVGFLAGMLISCIDFVIAYSRIPPVEVATNLGDLTSSVIRSEQERDILERNGSRIPVYRLTGYIFFGSANQINALFRDQNDPIDGVVLDFTKVPGIDSSAAGVLQRIVRRYRENSVGFYFVCTPAIEARLRAILCEVESDRMSFFASLDYALEVAEEALLRRSKQDSGNNGPFDILTNDHDAMLLRDHCVLRRVAAGEVLCREGDQSTEIFFIEQGSMEVFKSATGAARVRIAKLHANALVGELAFYTGEPRSASVVAVEASTVYVLELEALTRIRTEDPSLAMRFDQCVLRRIAHSLVRTNHLVASLR